jgi:hypothetical protein
MTQSFIKWRWHIIFRIVFLNSNTIKEGYTLLRFYPKEEVLKYYNQKVITDEKKKESYKFDEDFKLFKRESKNVQSTLEYINLLNKYPNVKKFIIESNNKTSGY